MSTHISRVHPFISFLIINLSISHFLLNIKPCQQQLHVPDGIDSDRGQESGPAQLVQTEVDVGAVCEQQRQAVRVLNGRRAEERGGAV